MYHLTAFAFCSFNPIARLKSHPSTQVGHKARRSTKIITIVRSGTPWFKIVQRFDIWRMLVFSNDSRTASATIGHLPIANLIW